MRQMKKRLFMGLVALAVCLGMFVLPGVNAATTTTVRAETAKKAAGKLMKAIKTCNDSKLGDFVYITDGSFYGSIKSKSPSYYNWMKKNNKKISYKIKSVKQKNGLADVKVQVKVADSSELAKNLVQVFDDYASQIVNNPGSTTGYTADTLYQKAIAKTKTPKFKKSTIVLHMAQYGSSWVLTSDTTSDDKFKNLLCCNSVASAPIIKKGLKETIDNMISAIARKAGVSEEVVRTALGNKLSELEKQLGDL